ncbi:protein ENDOSPERM DEFECTIVE 1-like [Vicia villosa]|uniref:protein ENDOSPERM DEFECTIVE 1-like n=1 Tax=Vicia villosa TaxID=3911 RepID=UPI00273B73A7|nr:protein ENDOSPERM DEFECTIVE 1-like [Vicia villosa]
MQENNNDVVSENPTPHPHPPQPQQHNRRPKTREVSSRFMSPSISSTQRRQQRDDSDDENSESSFPIGYSFQKKLQQQQQRSVKLFKETTNRVFDNIPNPNPNPSSSSHHPSKQPSSRCATPCPSRPDTPIHTMSVSSRYRQTPHHQPHRPINARSSAAAKLFQSSGVSSSRTSRDDIDIHCSTQSLPELRSETGDVLMQQPKVPTGSVAEKFGNNLSRSVSLSSSGIDRVKVGGLPPVPPQYATKSAADARKGKKGSHQDDVTNLKLLHNRYLQWRFANAKVEHAMKVQQKECEKALLSRAMKISEMRDSVNKKRIELERLQRLQTLSRVLEAQTPYLDEWSVMEEGYSVSLTEAIQALLNASTQLPTGGNVRVDVKELGESLNAALKTMETIISNTQKLMPKAEEIDTSISELARVVGGERALIDECGGLLSKTHRSQVEECSLRAQLIQLISIWHKNKNKE